MPRVQMPDAYFRQTDADSQKQHLRAITALRSEQLSSEEVMLSSKDNARFTFISSGIDELQTVSKQIEKLPAARSLNRVLMFKARDGRLSLNLYDVDPPNDDANGESKRFDTNPATATAEEKAAMNEFSTLLASLKSNDPKALRDATGTEVKEAEFQAMMRHCSSAYVCSQLPRLLLKQLLMYKRVVGSERCDVDVETHAEGLDWAQSEVCGTLLTVAMPGVMPRAALRRILLLLELHHLELHRAQVDTIDDPNKAGAYVTLVRTVFRSQGEDTVHMKKHFSHGLDESPVVRLMRDAARLKWIDDPALRLAAGSNGAISLQQGEIMFALADLSLSILDHPLLSRHVRHARSQARPPRPHHAPPVAAH